ncbi:MAG: histidine phosphatase family protein [Rhizobiaceae bacterium]|nr:histidine phosphatase family protein [Rhizobiaceae bacterium]
MLPLAYFVRHGQTDWNAEGRIQGQADTDINELGRRQADANGSRLADIVGRADGFDFVASPKRRTRETMERVRAAMGLPAGAYSTDPRLIEMHFGDWQTFTLAELEAETPGSTAARDRDKWNFVPPGANAENYQMLADRIAPWLAELKRPTICVTHGGIIRVMFRLIEGWTPEAACTGSVPQDRILELSGGRLRWL